MSEYVIWNELGNVYIRMGAIDDAITAYLKAIEMNPSYGWPYSNMAFAHVKKGDYEEAIRLYKKSLELLLENKEKAISWNGLGDAYRHMQDYKSALEAYQRADQISSEPNRPLDDVDAPLLFPDEILIEDGLVKSSADILGKSALESPDHSGSKEYLFGWPIKELDENTAEGITHVDNGQHAKPFLDEGVSEKGSPQLSEWLRELIRSDAQQERKSLGLLSRRNNKDAPRISSTAPVEVDTASIGDTCNNLNILPENNQTVEMGMDSAGAQVDTEVDTEVKPDLYIAPPSYQNYSVNAEQKTKVDSYSDWDIRQKPVVAAPAPRQTASLDPVKAEIKKYEKIVSLNETNDRAWDVLGKLYKSLGRYTEAIQAFERAIAIAPHHEAYHYNLGLVFTVQNRYLDAIESFQNAIALNDQYILAHGALAGCYRRLGKHEEATDHIELAMPMMANESDYNRACFNAICGNNDQAIDLLKTALMRQEVSLKWVQSDPDLEGIREDARYQKLLQEFEYALVAN